MTTEIEKKRRELFRKIFANPPYEFCMARHTEDSASWPGNYVAYHVECAWQGFNAALDAVEIERPRATCSMFATSRDTMAASEGIDMCIAAITATGLGLKIKG